MRFVLFLLLIICLITFSCNKTHIKSDDIGNTIITLETPLPSTNIPSPSKDPQQIITEATSSILLSEFTPLGNYNFEKRQYDTSMLGGYGYENENIPINENHFSVDNFDILVLLSNKISIEHDITVNAISLDKQTFSKSIPYNYIHIVKTDNKITGYYFEIDFENKPWLNNLKWNIQVIYNNSILLEQENEFSYKDLYIYKNRTDDPFDIINLKQLEKNEKYFGYSNKIQNNYIILYYKITGGFLPLTSGKIISTVDNQDKNEFLINIPKNALEGDYFYEFFESAAKFDSTYPIGVFNFDFHSFTVKK
jgi:hypothetical protein